MNETIGVKGGKNDHLRRMRITRKQKEKLAREQAEDEETKALEKKVRCLQILSFIGAVPVAAVGQTVKTLYEDENKKRLQELNEVKDQLEKSNAYSEEDTKTIVRGLETNYLIGTLPEKVRKEMGLEYKDISKDIDNPEHTSVNVFEHFLEASKKDTAPVYEQERILGIASSQEATLEEKLEKLKSHKLVAEYEKQLKDVRSELRNLSFEYGVLESESQNVYDSKEADRILDRLNDIIYRLEKLKAKMSPEELKDYDDNYLYVLIENYLRDFKDGKASDDIKDSMLFILIAEKIAELDTKKDSLEQKITDKKESLQIDEAKLAELKEKYFNYEQFNNQLLRFQDEQDFILNDIREKMKNATRIEERLEIQVRALNQQGNRLRGLLGLQMMLPGARSARGIAAATGTYMYFMRNILNPQPNIRRYKVIRVEDYSRQIENSISDLNSISDTLYKTSSQLKKMISDFERNYKQYFDSVPECRALLSNLYKVQADLAEKEYELEKIKKEQQKNLEKNNAKVKTLDNKRVA